MLRLAMAALVLAVALPAYARHEGDYLQKVSTEFQTPCEPFAKPWAQGRLRVLFIAPRTVAPREIVELAQRLDLDFDAFLMAHSGLMSYESIKTAAPYDLAVEGTAISEKSAELISKVDQRWDAFVVANITLDVLPKEAQYKLLKQVADGAGLLFTFIPTRLAVFKNLLPEAMDEILRGTAWEALPVFREADAKKRAALVRGYRFGQGRMAVLDWPRFNNGGYGSPSLVPNEPYDFHWQANYDHYLALVAKALLWTTPAKQARCKLAEVGQDGRVTIVAERAMKATLVATFRDRANGVEGRRELPLQLTLGENRASVAPPHLKAGGHFLDVVLRSEAGVEDFASAYFETDSPLKFTECSVEPEALEPGQKPTFRCSATAAGGLRLTLTDTHGRLYWQHEQKSGANAKVTLDLSRSRSIASHLHAELRLPSGEVADSRDFWVFVRRRASEEFSAICWGGVAPTGSGLARMAHQQLRQAGFTSLLSHPSADGAQERLVAIGDMTSVVYSYRIMGGVDERGWRREEWAGGKLFKDIEDHSVYSAPLRDAAKRFVLERIANVIRYGPWLYSLGDENYYGEKGGFSPADVGAFRVFLQREYGSLDALNRSWDAQFKTWAEVQPLKHDEALKQKKFPAVHDLLSFNEQAYADYHHFLADAIKSVDPRARVGAEGSEPGDVEKNISKLELWGPYERRRDDELLRSIAPKSLVVGHWWGGYVGSHGGRQKGAAILWRQLLRGNANCSLWFAATGSEGLFRGDLSYANYFQAILPELREIYGGLGQLLAASQQRDDGVAIHWSQASEHAATMVAEHGSPNTSQGNLLATLERLGVHYRYITTRQIESHKLVKGDRRVRVVFLACSLALSDKEAAALRMFVRLGGHVIADVGCGVLDGHCKPREKPALDDLFASGGRAIKLGEPFPAENNADGMRRIGKLLSKAGRTPVARLVSGANGLLRVLEHRNMLLLGVLRDGEQREDWQLELDKPAHLYDARLGRSLGLTKSLSLPKDGPPVRIFAALPEPAGQLAVNAPSSAKAGTDVSVVIRLPHGGGRIVRLETFRPDGQEVVGYRRYTMLGSDKATVTWPLAHNDAKGTWTLRATDVATGIAAEANVEVKP